MNKKILFVLPKFEFGGTVFSTFNMIRMLQRHGGYDISVFPMIEDGPVRNVYKGINVLDSNFLLESYYANRNEYAGLAKYKYLAGKAIDKVLFKLGLFSLDKLFDKVAADLQSKHHFDFVASCQEGDSTELVSHFRDCKRLAWFRSEMSVYLKKHISEERAKRLSSIYGRIDSIVCVSKTTRDDFAQYFPEIDERIIAIHNIQDVNEILKKASQKIDDPFDKQYFTLVSVGRMAPQKRFASIPKIASELVSIGLKNFRWYIIGDGNTAGEYDCLIKELDKYQMREYVKPIGSRINPYPYIQSADALVIPSSYEACPRVVAEAHILKVPVISADYSSAAEFVHHGKDGFVAPLENLKDYIALMIKQTEEGCIVTENCKSYQLDTDIILEQLLKVFSK